MSRIRWPAEWEPRHGSLLAWPGGDPWTGRPDAGLVGLYRELIGLLRAIEPVHLLVAPDRLDEVAALLGGQDESLRLEPLPVNDLWLRDSGPISIIAQDGQPSWLDGRFNGWGGKFPHELDALVPLLLARRWGQRRRTLPIRLEGGAIEGNGQGDLLTTRSVLLNPNRGNPGQTEVESALREHLGVERIHWLDRGLGVDHTDGHIDNLARFVSPGQIVCLAPGRPGAHPDHATLLANRASLDQLRPAGGKAEVIELPTTLQHATDGQLLAASHANFYLAPGLVLVPCFGDNSDDEALGILRTLFPRHRVEGLDCRALIAQGGGLHCIIQPLRLRE
jgi:agmatine deiminase